MSGELLARLEARHDEERASARRRLEHAEEFVALYRSEMRKVQEQFHAHAAHRGINDDPGFVAGMQRVTEDTDENVRAATRLIDECDHELQELIRRQEDEREQHAGG